MKPIRKQIVVGFVCRGKDGLPEKHQVAASASVTSLIVKTIYRQQTVRKYYHTMPNNSCVPVAADNRVIVRLLSLITIRFMERQISLSIVDNRPLIVQALAEQIATVRDMRLAATGQVGDHILPIAQTWHPDILVVSTDMPQAENNDVIRFQPMPMLRILKRRYPDTKVIFLVSNHLPVLAYLAERMGVMGYILLQDPRMASIVDVIRHVRTGRMVYSKAVREEQFYLAIQDKGLSDTQINILGAVATDPSLSQQQIARTIGITHGSLRNALSQLFQACGVRNLLGVLLATQAVDMTQFQLKPSGKEEETGVGLFGRTAHPRLPKQAIPNVPSL